MSKHRDKLTVISQRGAVNTVVVVVLVIIFTLIGAAAAYFARQPHINNLNNKVSSLNTRVSQLQGNQSSNQPAQQPSSGSNGNSSGNGNSYTSPKGVKVIIYEPANGATVSSPVGVIGRVPGNWSSEASFPVVLKDSTGKAVASGNATVLGNWQTTQLVPFSAKLTYSTSPTGSGTLVLEKDNPSGQTQNDDSVSIPVKF